MFQSAPLTEARGDSSSRNITTSETSFNPLPSPKRGETLLLETSQHPRQVSIRSPHRSEGRRGTGKFMKDGFFVSIRSPHRSEGRHSIMEDTDNTEVVSIRSPHRSEGRPMVSGIVRSRNGFQSAPLTEARGDACKMEQPEYMKCFNPLPSPKRGETTIQNTIDHLENVSIRSPHRSEGRPIEQRFFPYGIEFQSAPLTEARGDFIGTCSRAKHWSGFNPLPSPKRGETFSSDRECQTPMVSIRSPHRSEGRRQPGYVSRGVLHVSIRSPHRSEGRHYDLCHTESCIRVSIRSPHRSEGRLTPYFFWRPP